MSSPLGPPIVASSSDTHSSNNGGDAGNTSSPDAQQPSSEGSYTNLFLLLLDCSTSASGFLVVVSSWIVCEVLVCPGDVPIQSGYLASMVTNPEAPFKKGCFIADHTLGNAN